MIRIEDTSKPIFGSRKDYHMNKRRMELVQEDATGTVIVVILALFGLLMLGFLASPILTRWMLYAH